ncbi:MAG: hypothetical protein AAGG38_12045 [Planctomycetota bacterium]
MRRNLFLVLATATVWVWTWPTAAAIRPSFDLDSALARATDIAWVDEGAVIDGDFTVRRVWRGELEVGETLMLPDLAEMADPDMRVPHRWILPGQEADPPIAGRELIVFLVRPAQDEPDPDTGAWRGAGRYTDIDPRYGGVWLEGGRTYSFVQVINPGPSVLTEGVSRLQMEATIAAHQVIQAGRDAAVAEGDAAALLDAVWTFDAMGFHLSSLLGFEAVSGMGAAGAEQLRGVLADRSRLAWHAHGLEALVRTGQPGVEDDLWAAVDEGYEYFRETLPSLQAGWWNHLEDPRTSGHREQYGRLIRALGLLREVHPVPRDHPRLVQLVDLWTHHQSATRGLEQMVEACVALDPGLNRESP